MSSNPDLILTDHEDAARSDWLDRVVPREGSTLHLDTVNIQFVGVSEVIVGLEIKELVLSPALLIVVLLTTQDERHCLKSGISLCQAQYLVPFLQILKACLPR